MRVLSKLPALAGAIVAVLVALPAVASARVGQDHYLYVDDNTATANTVAGFVRHLDGSLTPVPGSPFAIGGAGLGKGLASQGAVAVAGRFLLAVDPGSNEISVARIRPNGTLEPVPGGPFSSGGNEPVSIAVHGDLVYVANAGAGGANYTGFRLGANGALTPIPGSTIALADSAGPGDILFNPTGTRLVAMEVGTSLIDSYTVSPEGRLIAAPGSPFAAQGPGPFGSEFSPINPTQLFVSNAHGGTGNGTVSAFADADNGVLSSIGSSPVPDNQTAPCWLVVSPDGSHLFAVNTGSTSISSYAIAADGAITLVGTTTFRSAAGTKDAAISPDGRLLYVLASGSDAVASFAVDGGALSEVPSSPTPLPAGATAAGLAVN